MATLGSPSPPSSPRRRRTIARRIERCCCSVASFFPLAFVYGLTTWAVWVELKIGFTPAKVWTGRTTSTIGLILYLLLNWSYTTAVFTDPGTPLEVKKNGYSNLPTLESRPYSSFTVKSTGDLRFCKKCETRKPDRAHHCSTCRRCVLKMDHHCPWLATCVGLHNYKAFLLFLVYLTLFCWACFAISATWVWSEMLQEDTYEETIMPVNFILLAVLSGIIGVVITGFTGWHLYLTAHNTTTIEKLEKTRYLSPLRRSMQHHLSQRHSVDPITGRPSFGDQLREIHANALPGITRPEEGEDSRTNPPHSGLSAAQNSLRRNYNDLEAQRERDRYADYMDEVDSGKLPHAFDLGWKRNYEHVFGTQPLLWFFPICNSTGDGWQWEASDKWIMERDRIRRERESEMRIQRERERAAGWGVDTPQPSPWVGTRPAWANNAEEEEAGIEQDDRFLTTSNGVARIPLEGRRSPSKADQILGRISSFAEEGTPMQVLDRRRISRTPDPHAIPDDDEVSSDEENAERRTFLKKTLPNGPSRVPPRSSSTSTQSVAPAENWNDIPEDMLARQSRSRPSSAVPSRGGMAAVDPRVNGHRSQKEQEWESWSPR